MQTETSQKFPSRIYLIGLYHTARAAGHSSRHDRMLYAHKNALIDYPNASPKQVWLAIEEAIA
jgi:hypothetical protein